MSDSQQVAIVLHPFGTYAKGDIVKDPKAIAVIQQGGQASLVVITELPSPVPTTSEQARS